MIKQKKIQYSVYLTKEDHDKLVKKYKSLTKALEALLNAVTDEKLSKMVEEQFFRLLKDYDVKPSKKTKTGKASPGTGQPL